MSATRGPLPLALGLSLALHAYALFALQIAQAPLYPGHGNPALVLQAHLASPPPPAPAARRTLPEVLKNTLDPPHAEVLREPIEPERRARAERDAAPSMERVAPSLAPRALELRSPGSEPGAAGPRAPPVREAEGLPPEQLRETLGRLSEEMLYPADALRSGLEGEVVLLVELGDGGRIVDASVASGSGHAVLDNAAVRAVRKIGTLGPSSAHKTILLPVRFRIL